MSIQRILVAHDLSEASHDALRLAVEMAQRHDASIVILHVYAIPVIPMPEGYLAQAPSTIVEVQRIVHDALEAAKATARELGARWVLTEAVAGSAGPEIVAAARRGGFDLVVMGTHGRKGIRRMILGSVAEYVVRRAPCPVLTVHPSGREEAVEHPQP